jgi:hypothetical protein
MAFADFSAGIRRRRVSPSARPMTGSGWVAGIPRRRLLSASLAITGPSAFKDEDNKEQ